MRVSLKVNRNDIPRAEKFMSGVRSRMSRVVREELEKTAKRAIADFQKRAWAGAFGQRGRRGPALIETGNYVASWKEQMLSDTEVAMGPTGQNRNMSNEALGELLEEDIPHQRTLVRWFEKAGRRELGRNISRRVFGGG